MKRLNEQARNNGKLFSAGFMFQLAAEEKVEVVAKCDHLATWNTLKAELMPMQKLKNRLFIT